MQDEEFLSQFENCTLPKSEFKHKSHLRLSWLYLMKYEFPEAEKRIKESIIRYATSLGALHIYNEELTNSWIHLIKKAMDKENAHEFDAFLMLHPYLLEKSLK